jgi:hypothetical protein
MARPARRRSPSLGVEWLESRDLLSTASGSLQAIPQHYSWIRIAELAYQGTPVGSFESQLLQQSVDLVIQGSENLSNFAAAAPGTPQLIYTNLSNIYGSLLTNWLSYAHAHGMNPEDAFYHVQQATPFQGGSPSSQPVDWFWAVSQGGGNTWTDLTSQAHRGAPGGVTFAQPGDSVAFGYPEKFRQLNVSLASGASGGWSYTLEYPTAVDSSGKPTAWGTLHPLSNTTAHLTRSGTITFDPPANWKPASLNGSAPLYYVRVRTTAAGTAPVATAVRGRDYTQSNDTNSGVIPVFDYAADKDHDGYLNDQEYAVAVAAGMYARFAYESRLFYAPYGQMRFATNVSNESFRQWAVDYAGRFLRSQPLADGLFVDNSPALPPAAPGQVVEDLSSYAANYASLLKDLRPAWVLANTGGGGTNADGVVRAVPGSFQENALQPLAANYQDFEALATLVAQQQALGSSPYLVLDSVPTGGSPSSSRTQLTTLAEYYLLADPNKTLLDFFGGFEPGTSWSRHWSPAVTYNVGQPTGAWSVAATGADPSNPSLEYRVYQRSYSNALVLYKPLSYGNGVTGTTGNSTGTNVRLDGTYYPLRADGTLGPAVTSVWLRNGEGVVLARTSPAAASTLTFSGLPASAKAGQTVHFTITAQDVFGNLATGYRGTVNLTSTDLGAMMPAHYTFTAADQGKHTFTVTMTTAGPQIIAASDQAQPLTAGSAGLAVTPGAPRRLAVSAAPTATAGQHTGLTVTAVDGFGNVVPDYRGTVYLTSSDPAAWLSAPYTFTASNEGTHTFWPRLITAGPQIVTAADRAGTVFSGSDVLNVAAGAA